MKRNYAILLASLFVAGACCSCSEKEEMATTGDDNVPGDYIDFTVGELGSRTVRDESDKYQLLWEEGDSVRIYCEQASTDEGLHYADYAVIPDASDARKGKLAFNPHGLRWNEQQLTHKFYAICGDTTTYKHQYPFGGALQYKDGIIDFGYYYNQEFVYNNTGVKNMFTHNSVANLMVASCETTNNKAVSLKFKPISTTLDVTFKNTNTIQHEIPDGISYSIENIPCIVTEWDDYGQVVDYDLKYDISTGKLLGDNKGWFGTSLYHFDENGGNHYITLQPGESMTFRIALPPVPINAEHQVILYVPINDKNGKYIEMDRNRPVGGQTVDGHVLECEAGGFLSVTINIDNRNFHM